jgi:hypothetical protein
MRQVLAGALLAGVLAVTTAALGHARSACDSPSNGKYVKPSSLAPGERAYNNAYGAPIPKPIVSRRVPRKAKSQPQLHTTPLPAA